VLEAKLKREHGLHSEMCLFLRAQIHLGEIMKVASHTKKLKQVALCVAIVLPLSAMAQTTSGESYSNRGYQSSASASNEKSWLPFTSSGYWGFNLGTPDYEKNCQPGFSCSDPDVGGKIYTGGQFNKWLGMELGYVNFGELERNGGDTKAHGVNLSVVGTVPMGTVVSAFAKVGTTYGWTKTEGVIGRTGKADDFGLSYGAGLGFNLSAQTQLLVEWDRHNLKFADRDSDVDMYSVGLKFRF
jgi:OOP family OmpA-OmpF porin